MKKYFYPLCLGIALSFPMFGQWTLLGTVKNAPSDVYNLERFQMKKTGEKVGYYDATAKSYKLFNRDGSSWKTYKSATQAQCIGAQQVSAPFWNRQTLSTNSDFEYVFSCNEDPATGLRSFGIADETGKTIHLFPEKLGDVFAYNSGVFTMSKPLLGTKVDTLRTVDFYKNTNGVLTKTKTFSNTRFVGEVQSKDPKFNGTHYFELTKDRKLRKSIVKVSFRKWHNYNPFVFIARYEIDYNNKVSRFER